MATRKCPDCGASVKLENLERHVSSVHPGRSVELTGKERRAIQTRRAGERGLGIPRRTVAVAVLLVLGVALVGAWALYVPKPGSLTVTNMHIHTTLRIMVDGTARTVPADIGIEPALWRDHTLDSYGIGGMSPLHTHDATGLIHVESHGERDYTIGELFSVWGQSFDVTQVLGHPAAAGHRVWMVVDGTEMAPTNSLVLRDRMQVHIICDVG